MSRTKSDPLRPTPDEGSSEPDPFREELRAALDDHDWGEALEILRAQFHTPGGLPAGWVPRRARRRQRLGNWALLGVARRVAGRLVRAKLSRRRYRRRGAEGRAGKLAVGVVAVLAPEVLLFCALGGPEPVWQAQAGATAIVAALLCVVIARR